ncbi:MAG: 16S rRNA (guanine(966)-N(2))-methyltransferase RsmD [Terracidiphilus sp.]
MAAGGGLCWWTMRIIAGRFGSRSLAAPAGEATRPTSDRLRETLFNVLAPRIEGSAFLDLYAGSGAVGIEALSRGASRVTFVERAPAALKMLRANLASLGLNGGFRIHAGAASAFLRRGYAGEPPAFDVIFLDPPYDAAQEYAATLDLLGGATAGLQAAGGLVIAEHRRKSRLEAAYGNLVRVRLLEQGDAAVSFYASPLTGPGSRLKMANKESRAKF